MDAHANFLSSQSVDERAVEASNGFPVAIVLGALALVAIVALLLLAVRHRRWGSSYVPSEAAMTAARGAAPRPVAPPTPSVEAERDPSLPPPPPPPLVRTTFSNLFAREPK